MLALGDWNPCRFHSYARFKFEGLDVENIESLKQTLTDMAIGMSTVHTRLTGLILVTHPQTCILESND